MKQYGVTSDAEVLDMIDTVARQKEVRYPCAFDLILPLFILVRINHSGIGELLTLSIGPSVC
jgi:hypothetical protein